MSAWTPPYAVWRFAGAHELDEGAERAPVDCADAIGVADARLFL
jgi:hypothetical protein